MLTNIFPIPGISLVNSTSVCYYFAKEWAKMGYEVVVVYNYGIYASALHFLAHFFEKKISSVFPTVINKKRFTKKRQYELDGVKVILLPCYKFLPKIPFSKRTIKRQVWEIQKGNKELGFHPDVIVGHFLHPSLEIVSRLKTVYNVRTAIILHGEISSCNKRDIDSIKQLKECIDIWGYRSHPIRKSFEQLIDVEVKSFMCFSGVPLEYVSMNSFLKTERSDVQKYIYVGNLIKRKYPIRIIEALNRVYGRDGFQLTVVGTGDEDQKMRQLVNRLGIIEHVTFHGRLQRDMVKEELFKSECFIMISEAETFGLVYLEAMANGCIVIASRNEGMDGIIEDGYNGFLCKSGDVIELSMVISKIRRLSKVEKVRISQKAIDTALNMTDAKMAQNYINNLLIK